MDVPTIGGCPMNLEQAVKSLPPEARKEIFDFVAFLQQKYRKRRTQTLKEDAAYWSAISEQSVRKVWDNEEDDIYNELLQR